MGTVRLGAFPSLNNKNFQDEIAMSIFKWILNRFPMNFFNNIYLDTQNTSAYSYILNTDGEYVKPSPGGKILTPSFRMNFKHIGNNVNDVFGNFWNVNQQPGAFAIDTDLTGYKPILYDPYGCIIATNEYTIRNNFDVSMEVTSKADQLALLNICETNLKHMYVQTIMSEPSIVLPNLMLEYLRNCVFKNEIDVLSKMISDSKERAKYRSDINMQFAEYLYEFSGNSIKPFTEHVDETGVKKFMYKLFREQRITMKMDRVEIDEGNKKGGSYTSFGLSFSGWCEYANPITFITSTPAIIRGKKTDHFLMTSSNKGKNKAEHCMWFKEVFRDDRHLKKINLSVWTPFYLESEIMMAKEHEKFNILDDVICLEDTPSHYYITKAILSTIEDINDFNNIFNIIIYKNNEPLRNNEFFVDHKFNIEIPNCDLSVPYYIEVFVHKTNYVELMNRINKKLYDLGVTISKNELNWHINNHNNRPRYYVFDDEEYWDYMHRRGRHYLTKNIVGRDSKGQKTFVPIKTIDFIKADPQYTYYIRNGEEYREVRPEVLETRTDVNYYIYTDNKFILIDRNKVMMPDDEYLYYKFDKKLKRFVLCTKLKQFDPKIQYYILHDQHEVHDLILGAEEQ